MEAKFDLETAPVCGLGIISLADSQACMALGIEKRDMAWALKASPASSTLLE